jgi:hypothetical protein
MDETMSAKTKLEVLTKLRWRYGRAGMEHKGKLIDQAVSVLGYHRKAAIRALNGWPPVSVSIRTGRPRQYEGQELLPVLRQIWRAANYPCSRRLQAMLPDWLAGYEQYEKSVRAAVREPLLQASARTLDRLLLPLRAQRRRPSLTRPGSLLRHQIPIRGSLWEEDKPGWLEVDTVALCGGSVAGDFIWMVDGVDYVTAWVSLRAMWNRGQEGTLRALQDIEKALPFELLGLDSDNGGEFLNYHVLHWLQKRPRPIYVTRSRPYKKDDNAHVEQKNWTHVRQWFGYERYDNAEAVEPINELVRGPYAQLLNYFHANLKLERTERKEGQLKKIYQAARTPLARVLDCAHVCGKVKERLRQQKSRLNPFALKAEVERKLKSSQDCADKKAREPHRRRGPARGA